MEQQIDIRFVSNFIKTVAVAALIVAGAMALQRGFTRVSTAVDSAWATDSSWITKGGLR
jgi:L-asparagine transporter-like permease